MASKITTGSLSAQAVRRITDMILVEGRFRVGDKIPNELELSQELGISRITLREAVRVLRTRGILEIRRGKGTFVVSTDPALDPAAPSASSAAPLDMAGTGTRDKLELLSALEPSAAWYAARRATEEELREIDSIRLSIEELASQRRPCVREEEDFHRAVALASGNPLFKRVLPQVNEAYFAQVQGSAERSAWILRDYQEMARYLLQRNGEGARAMMQGYLLHAWQFSRQDIE